MGAPRFGVWMRVITEGTLAKMFNWPRGPMDKASAYGAGDCRFESCRGHLCCGGGEAGARLRVLCGQRLGP